MGVKQLVRPRHRTYGEPVIRRVEVSCDFAEDRPWSLKCFGEIYQKLQSWLPEVEDSFSVDLVPEEGAGAVGTRLAGAAQVRYLSGDRSTQAVVSHGHLELQKARQAGEAYDGWRTALSRFRDAADAYSEVTGEGTVAGIGVTYVNDIGDVSLGDVYRLVHLAPRVENAVCARATEYISGVAFPVAEGSLRVTLVGHQRDKLQVILVLSYSRALDPPVDIDGMVDALELAHDGLYASFEELISDELRATMEVTPGGAKG